LFARSGRILGDVILGTRNKGLVMLDYEVHAAFSANNSYRLYKDLKDASSRRKIQQAREVKKHLIFALELVKLEIQEHINKEDEDLL